MRSYAMKLTVAGMAAAVGLSLTACDPNPDSASAKGTTATAGTSTGGATPSASATGAADGAGSTAGASAGGSKGLTMAKYGQPASVDFANDKKQIGKLQVTVTGIRTGTLQDLQAAKIPTTGLEGRTPVYVSYAIKNTSDVSFSFTAPDTKLMVMDSTGRGQYNVLSAATPLPACTGGSFVGFAKNAEVKGCIISSIPAGTKVAWVAYTGPTNPDMVQVGWEN